MKESDKPHYVKLLDKSFDAPGQQTAATWILLLWPETQNFSEIGRRSGWSKSQIRNVYQEYFTEADSHKEMVESANEAGLIFDYFGGVESSKPHARGDGVNVDEYKSGYRDGYRDGVHDAENTNFKD